MKLAYKGEISVMRNQRFCWNLSKYSRPLSLDIEGEELMTVLLEKKNSTSCAVEP